MKKTFTREEVKAIIKDIYTGDYDSPMYAWAEFNGLDRELAIYTATNEYMEISKLLQESN